MKRQFTLLTSSLLLIAVSLCIDRSARAQSETTPAEGPRSTKSSPPNAADYPGPQAYPDEIHQLVAEHLSRARKLAGTDLFQDMAHRCIISPLFPLRVNGIQYLGKITPTKLFDNLYSVGQNEVSSQALVTSAGINSFRYVEQRR